MTGPQAAASESLSAMFIHRGGSAFSVVSVRHRLFSDELFELRTLSIQYCLAKILAGS